MVKDGRPISKPRPSFLRQLMALGAITRRKFLKRHQHAHSRCTELEMSGKATVALADDGSVVILASEGSQ
jgi:hypothetical protein